MLSSYAKNAMIAGVFACRQVTECQSGLSGAVCYMHGEKGVTGHTVGNARFVTMIKEDHVRLAEGMKAMG